MTRFTKRQEQALADIFHAQRFLPPVARIGPDMLNIGSQRALSTLVSHGLVERKRDHSSRRISYRLTAEGQLVAGDAEARLSDEAARQSAARTR